MPKVILKFEMIEERSLELELTPNEFQSYEKLRSLLNSKTPLTWQDREVKEFLEKWSLKFEEDLLQEALQLCGGGSIYRNAEIVEQNSDVQTKFLLVSSGDLSKEDNN